MNGDRSLLDPRVRAALDAADIAYDVVECAPELADTAEFCAHYGIPPANACNTILVVAKTTPKQYYACLVAADTKLDIVDTSGRLKAGLPITVTLPAKTK